MADEQIILVCLEVTEGELPPDMTSVRGEYCMECATEVWMSPLMKAFWKEDVPNGRIVCGRCSIEMMDEDPDIETRTLPGDRVGEALAAEIGESNIPALIRRLYGYPPRS